MGADASAFLSIGFPVSREDFWTERSAVRKDCPNGHSQKDSDWIVCPSCGGKFNEPYTILEPTNNFQRFCTTRKLNPTDILDEDAIQPDRKAFDGLDIIDSQAVQSSEDGYGRNDPREWVIGKTLARISSEGNAPPHPISQDKITTAFAECKLMADALGLGDREVSLYPGVYWSV